MLIGVMFDLLVIMFVRSINPFALASDVYLSLLRHKFIVPLIVLSFFLFVDIVGRILSQRKRHVLIASTIELLSL